MKVYRLLLVFCVLSIAVVSKAAIITTTGSGNWSSVVPNAPWPGGIIPLATDDIIIGAGFTLTVNGNRTANSLTVGNGSTITVNAGITLTITANFSFPNLAATNTTGTIGGLGTINASTMSIAGSVVPTASRTVIIISTITSLNVTNNLTVTSQRNVANTNNPTFQLQSGTVTVNGTLSCVTAANAASTTLVTLATGAQTGTLILGNATPISTSGNAGVSTFTFTGASATVNYSGAAQTVFNVNYTNLTLSGSGIKTLQAGTTSIGGNLTLSGTASTTTVVGLTITGSVAINGSATWNNTANVAISIGGNLSVAAGATFTQGTGLVTFTGATSNTVTNTGTIAFGGGINVDKGTSQANVIDFQGPITMLAGGLTLTNGTFKLSSASTITAFTVDPNFGATAQLWCNGGTIQGGSTSVTYSGAIQVTAGTLNIGTSASHYLFPKGGSLTISGGALNVTGPLSDSPAGGATGMNFNISAGTCTVATATGSTADYPFLIQTSGTILSQFTMTGGTIVIQNSTSLSGFSTNAGYYNHVTGGTFSGGTLQIGNASTPASSIIEIDSTVPIFNLTINSSNVMASVKNYLAVAPSITVTNNVTISSGTLNANSSNVSVGGNWTNNGTFTNNYGTVTFNGTTTQTVGGTSPTTFNNMTLSGTNTVSFSVATTIGGTLTQNAGAVINPNSLTHTARTYIQGGTPQAPSSFGSTSSSATNKSNTFFTAGTTGILNVSNRIYFTRQTGNWNSNTSWSTVTYGNATNAGTFPAAGDDANVGGGFTITVTAAVASSTLFYQSAASSNSVSLNSGITLAVSRGITLSRPTTAGFTNTLAVGAGTLTAGSLLFTNNGTLDPTHALTISTGTATISGDVITDGTSASPTITFSGSGILNLAGSILNSSNCTFTAGTGTVNYNATTVSQVIGDFTYNNLTWNNTTSTIPQLSLRANTSAANRLTMTSGVVDMGGFTLTLSSSATGALSHSLLSTAGWMYGGTFTRSFPATAITVGTSQDGLMPMGTSTDFRPFFFGKSNTGGSTGTISMTHSDPVTTTTGLSIADGASTIVNRNNAVWGSTLTGGTAATFGIRYGGTGLGTVTNLIHLRSMLLNSTIATHVAASGSLTDPRVERSTLSTAQMSNNFYAGSINTASPLPIELTYFSAILKNSVIELSWTTASELNNDFFTIERSGNGEKFETVKTVKGKGTTNLTSYYQDIDENPLFGKSYYQLKQTDFDGHVSYSDVVVIENNSTAPVKIYPNPILENRLTVEMEGLQIGEEVPVSIIDMKGVPVFNAIYQAGDTGKLKNPIELSSLPSGVYIVMIKAAKGVRKKIIIP
jgi:Secretion system C-terminal sorting domain